MKYSITLILTIILLGGLLVWQGIFTPVESDSEEVVFFLVKKGQDAGEIANNLKSQDLIKYSSLFKWYALIFNKADKLKAGEYELFRSMTVPEIIDKLTSGEMIKKTITIIEGWSLRNIGEYLEDQGIALSEQLFALDNKEKTDSYFSNKFDFLKDKPKNLGVEGYLFPDTYELSPEDGLEDIVIETLYNFNNKISDLKEEIFSQDKTLFEIITMASLIEKEVRTFTDKRIVAGVLWKRLEVGMPLQVDATITYITGRKSTEILKEELEIDSLYNTYKYKGLPRGPICSPGIKSIEAAIRPTETEYWFYLSTPDGETIFSRTLKEHNEAAVKYLK